MYVGSDFIYKQNKYVISALIIYLFSFFQLWLFVYLFTYLHIMVHQYLFIYKGKISMVYQYRLFIYSFILNILFSTDYLLLINLICLFIKAIWHISIYLFAYFFSY